MVVHARWAETLTPQFLGFIENDFNKRQYPVRGSSGYDGGKWPDCYELIGRQMANSSKRPYQRPFLSTKNKKPRLQFTQGHRRLLPGLEQAT